MRAACFVVAVMVCGATALLFLHGPESALSGGPQPPPTVTPQNEKIVRFANFNTRSAVGLQVVVPAGQSLGSFKLIQNGAGCPGASTGILSIAEGITEVELAWGRACVDPGEDVVLRLRGGCPTCPISVASHTWLLAPWGDVDCDGDADPIDAYKILRYNATLLAVLPCPWHGYITDLRIDALDAMLVLQYTAGLLPSLPPTVTRTGVIVLAQGVEDSCLALDTGQELLVLWEPMGLVKGQRVELRGVFLPAAASLCSVGPIFSVSSVIKLD